MSNKEEYTKESIKAINEFMVDIIGVWVPGTIFLFSVIICVVIPFIIIYMPPLNCGVKQIDLLISNVFQGWFWLVLFFTFLILAYAIGNIFYRLDIKKIDRKSFDYERKKHEKRFNEKYPEDLLSTDSFVNDYFDLMYNHLTDKDREIFDKIIENKTDMPEKREELRRVEWKKMEQCLKKLINDTQTVDAQIVDTQTVDTQTVDTQTVDTKTADKKTINAKKVNYINSIAYHLCNKNNIFENNDKTITFKKDTFENASTTLPDETEKHPRGRVKEWFNKFILRKKTSLTQPQKDSIDCAKDPIDYAKEIDYAKKMFLKFTLRSETACDNKDDCQFPYPFYNTYLIKRNETHLLEHVSWCYDESSRSKNALNKLKLKVQLIANKDYNILIKNEAHIRMSSSSWYAAMTNKTIGWIFFVLFLLIVLFKDNISFLESLNFKDFHFNFQLSVILIFPLSVYILNWNIHKSAIKFLHYQRLREIFFVLQVYDEYFGLGCVNRGKRKNDESFRNTSS